MKQEIPKKKINSIEYLVGWYTQTPFKNGIIQKCPINQGIFIVKTKDIISLETIFLGEQENLHSFKELITTNNWQYYQGQKYSIICEENQQFIQYGQMNHSIKKEFGKIYDLKN